jgi:hypothetical protein
MTGATDKRELILSRLLDVLDGVQSGMVVLRNAPQIDPDSRPALILYDGDEQSEPRDPNRGGPPSIRRVRMTPSIIALASAAAENIGTAINELRALVVHAVLTDATLLGYSVNGLEVTYEGAEQIVENGLRVEGAMALTFAITYTLRTADLVSASA